MESIGAQRNLPRHKVHTLSSSHCVGYDSVASYNKFSQWSLTTAQFKSEQAHISFNQFFSAGSKIKCWRGFTLCDQFGDKPEDLKVIPKTSGRKTQVIKYFEEINLSELVIALQITGSNDWKFFITHDTIFG